MTAARVSITTIRPRVVVTNQRGVSVTVSASGRPRVEVHPQGLRGPAGPSSEVMTTLAVGPVSALRVVASTVIGAQVVNPSSVDSLARIIGISVNAAADGDLLTVRRMGLLSDPAWSWIAGQPIFCGLGGVLTAVAPTAVAIRQVAVAVDATTILIDPSDLILME